jgi:23S rRNA (adenine2503-C2)-methyltransferase
MNSGFNREVRGMVLKGLTQTELARELSELKLPSYRINQIFAWLYQNNISNWEEMTNLPQELRHRLRENGYSLGILTLRQQLCDKRDGTVKYLLELTDKLTIECVYLPETGRETVCFSTQAGCALGCRFCATGRGGFQRNLTAAEMLEQPLLAARMAKCRISNLVAMGQGEPLANYDQVLKMVRIANDPQGMGIGARHITISTCGLPPGIFRMAREGIQVNLAVSLHAATDKLRDELMPINRQYPLGPLREACLDYIARTGRRITFEYAMIDGINDRTEDLNQLIRYLDGLLCHVNLIPLNPVPGLDWRRSPTKRVKSFASALIQAGVETTVRKERGADLAAACGQLQGSIQ